MESYSDALVAFEKWLVTSRWLMDRLEFQRDFEGVFQGGTGRAFDDCLANLSDEARKTVEACMLEFYISRRPVNDMLREFTPQASHGMSYQQLMYLLSLGHAKASIYEVAYSDSELGFILKDLIRGGSPTQIPHGAASKVLVKGDRLLTRVVKNKIGIVISGGSLVIPPQLWPHLSAKIEGQLVARRHESPTEQEVREDLAEEMTWYTLSCWLNAYSGPGAPPPKLIAFDRG